MRLLHRALRLLSDYLMLPLFGLLGGTRDSTLGGRICVLHTVGRKSGQPRQIPLNFVPTTESVGLLAGFGRGTGWLYNLRAQPEATIMLGSESYRVTAVEITDPAQALEVTRGVLRNAGAMGYFYGWDPRTASDEQVQAVVDETFCFHMRFEESPSWA
jgi:deazaflavin-dependent oxidoreductase (nitroreductase family)